VKERVAELARLAGAEENEAAGKLLVALNEELDRAIEEAATMEQGAAQHAAPPRAPRETLVKCPRCALRNFIFQKGTMREAGDAEQGFEAYYVCTSCGHEGWRETD
jgi:DNA-directed RNA polymerase subunit M/transcription elongation factor TFIIS